MVSIKVIDVIGTEFAVAEENGLALRKSIQKINKKEKVNLDFSGISRITALFFKVSLCDLWSETDGIEYSDKFTISLVDADCIDEVMAERINNREEKKDGYVWVNSKYVELRDDGVKGNDVNS